MLLLSLESLLPLLAFGAEQGLKTDAFAFVRYIFWWLLPTIMVSAAAGTLITVLTDTPAAILVCFAWWQIDRGMTGLSGDTSLWTLMIRHNTLRGAELIQRDMGILTANRALMIGIALVFAGLSAYLLTWKRRGRLYAAGRAARGGRAVRGELSA